MSFVLALTDSEGTLLTVGIIVLLVVVFGVWIFTNDMNWFD